MMMDVNAILRVCGPGSYLHIGCGTNTPVFELLKRSINAFGISSDQSTVDHNNDRAPGKFLKGTLMEYPFAPAAFDNIILGEELLF